MEYLYRLCSFQLLRFSMRVWIAQVNGGGQECPPHTLQYRSECSDYVAGFQWGFRAEPSLYLVAEILALADHVDGSSGGPADWPDAAFFGVV